MTEQSKYRVVDILFKVLDIDGRDRNDLDLIRRYRDIGQQLECDSAIEDIVNEAIVSDERDKSVDIVLDNLEYSEKIKKSMRQVLMKSCLYLTLIQKVMTSLEDGTLTEDYFITKLLIQKIQN